jgi:hypothetical protein
MDGKKYVLREIWWKVFLFILINDDEIKHLGH